MLLAGVAARADARSPVAEHAGTGWPGSAPARSLAAAAATALGAWANRLGPLPHPAQLLGLARAIAWFAWPAWLLALWTLWQWRRRLWAQHVIVPLACAATLLGVWVAMAGSDRALMLALPALAILAAFALPTLQRGAAAAIDWFSVFFFTIAVATGWLFYAAMQTGMPAKLAANVARLSPGYSHDFSLLALRAGVWRERWRGSGSCAGAPGEAGIRSGRAWCWRPAASASAGCW